MSGGRKAVLDALTDVVAIAAVVALALGGAGSTAAYGVIAALAGARTYRATR